MFLTISYVLGFDQEVFLFLFLLLIPFVGTFNWGAIFTDLRSLLRGRSSLDFQCFDSSLIVFFSFFIFSRRLGGPAFTASSRFFPFSYLLIDVNLSFHIRYNIFDLSFWITLLWFDFRFFQIFFKFFKLLRNRFICHIQQPILNNLEFLGQRFFFFQKLKNTAK